MTGLGYLAAALLGCSVGGVQAGLIDFTIFGILRGAESKWYVVVVLGICVAAAYYFGFKFLIKKFNINTPGRHEDMDIEEQNVNTAANNIELAQNIIAYLGGKENITNITNCFTRLRVTVVDQTLVDDQKLKTTGASGVTHPSETSVQVIYGLKVEGIARDVKAVYYSK